MSAIASLHFRDKGNHHYELDTAKLDSKKVYVIGTLNAITYDSIAIAAIEYIAFHPTTQSNDLFGLTFAKCGDVQLAVYSFPIEFSFLLDRIAEVYRLNVSRDERTLMFHDTLSLQNIYCTFPKCTNAVSLLSNDELQSKPLKNLDLNTFDSEFEVVTNFGDWLEKEVREAQSSI